MSTSTTLARLLRLVVMITLGAAMVLSALSVASPNASAQDRDPAFEQDGDPALSEFHEALDPNGEWVEHPRYGETWVPYANEDRGWRPYSRGQWVFTEEHGWYWESDEPWGWVVYHYGRWLLDDRYGWMWVPGTEWGPAWVAWREGDEAIGWAPLPPEAEFDGAIDGGLTFDAYASPRYAPMWMFVAPAMMTLPSVWRHFYPPSRSAAYFGQTRRATFYGYRDRQVFNRGIDRRFIERHTRRPVPVMPLRSMSSPREFGSNRRMEGERRAVGVYRPQFGPSSQWRGGRGPGSGPGPGWGRDGARDPARDRGFGSRGGMPPQYPSAYPGQQRGGPSNRPFDGAADPSQQRRQSPFGRGPDDRGRADQTPGGRGPSDRGPPGSGFGGRGQADQGRAGIDPAQQGGRFGVPGGSPERPREPRAQPPSRPFDGGADSARQRPQPPFGRGQAGIPDAAQQGRRFDGPGPGRPQGGPMRGPPGGGFGGRGQAAPPSPPPRAAAPPAPPPRAAVPPPPRPQVQAPPPRPQPPAAQPQRRPPQGDPAAGPR